MRSVRPKAMKRERWRQIDELLDEALECLPADRAGFLDKACAGDETLRREIETLLRSDERAAGFIETPALEVAAEFLTNQQPGLTMGESVSHYKILSPLGAGGMDEVYLAQDTRLERKVAIKILPAEFTKDEDRLRRFQQEARAASALNHPNIVTIHEIGKAGTTHFIVSEFIEGETLRQHIQKSRLMLDETLD